MLNVCLRSCGIAIKCFLLMNDTAVSRYLMYSRYKIDYNKIDGKFSQAIRHVCRLRNSDGFWNSCLESIQNLTSTSPMLQPKNPTKSEAIVFCLYKGQHANLHHSYIYTIQYIQHNGCSLVLRFCFNRYIHLSQYGCSYLFIQEVSHQGSYSLQLQWRRSPFCHFSWPVRIQAYQN